MPTYLERVDSRSPFKAGLDQSGGRVSCTYIVTLDDDETLEDLFEDILGNAKPDGVGGIERLLPKACPHFNLAYFFADRISELIGIGGDGEIVDVDDAEWLEAETLIDRYWEYKKFFVTIDYTRRPYKVLPDDSTVKPSNVAYYLEDGSGGAYVQTSEDDRFTWWEPQAQPEIITFQQGQAVFALDSSNISGSISGAAPHSFGFNATPQIYMPKTLIKYHWEMVPYEYVIGKPGGISYLRQYIGYLNQTDWAQWKAGELLYLGPNVKRYPPSRPEREVVFGTTFSTSMLCDIELTFVETSRLPGGTVPTPSNLSWIPAGHNLMPWSRDRKFYYAVTPDADSPNTTAKWVPTYPRSIPFQMLFTDPSV